MLSEEYRLRVFEYRVMRKLFRVMWDVVTGGWSELHNGQLNGLYCAPNVVRGIKWRRMSWVGHVERMENRRCIYRFLVGKPDIKGPERPRDIWEDNNCTGLEKSWRLRIPDFKTIGSPMHRPPLPPIKYFCYSFMLEADSNSGPQYGCHMYVSDNMQ
jgi:hypothetical protein